MFKAISGCGLGWEPEVILTTTIVQLELAYEGRIDFVRKTNPFGSGEETDEDKLKTMTPQPELAMQQLLGLVKRRQSEANRKGKK